MLNKTPVISIIVPVYNVEKYLSKCLNSILNQSFSEFELILVNDGSLDNCGEICEEYSKFDERIKVIHKKNGGLSSARNTGINIALGKYIVFIDPDDQICEDYFTKLYSIAEQNQCDAVISGYKTVPTNKVIYPNFKLNTVLTGKELILSSPNIHSNNDLCFVWRNIYKLKLIKEKNIRFNEQVFIGEDVIFNLEYFLESKRVYVMPESLYLYTVDNLESLMRAAYKPKLESSLVLQYKIRKQLSKKFGLLKYNHYKRDMANYYINNILRLIINNLKGRKGIVTHIEINRIVNYQMITDSLNEIGYFYKCNNIKEYLYFLALKFKIYPILMENFKKELKL
ncbi:glycosyltransferase [Neobacillus sp. BF23-41]|uniref:glycosyltransferase n=1 Tax=Neobacillus sp. BF23-41 TaxID=3240280 RepID=UPI0034E4DBFD